MAGPLRCRAPGPAGRERGDVAAAERGPAARLRRPAHTPRGSAGREQARTRERARLAARSAVFERGRRRRRRWVAVDGRSARDTRRARCSVGRRKGRRRPSRRRAQAGRARSRARERRAAAALGLVNGALRAARRLRRLHRHRERGGRHRLSRRHDALFAARRAGRAPDPRELRAACSTFAAQLRSSWADADARGAWRSTKRPMRRCASCCSGELSRSLDVAGRDLVPVRRQCSRRRIAARTAPAARPHRSLVQQLRHKLDPFIVAIDNRLAPFLEQIRSGRAATPEFRALAARNPRQHADAHRATPTPRPTGSPRCWVERTRDGSSSRTKGWGNVAGPVRWTLTMIDQVHPTTGTGRRLRLRLGGRPRGGVVRPWSPTLRSVASSSTRPLPKWRARPSSACSCRTRGPSRVTFSWPTGQTARSSTCTTPFFEPIASEVCDRLVEPRAQEARAHGDLVRRHRHVSIEPILTEVRAGRWTFEPGPAPRPCHFPKPGTAAARGRVTTACLSTSGTVGTRWLVPGYFPCPRPPSTSTAMVRLVHRLEGIEVLRQLARVLNP